VTAPEVSQLTDVGRAETSSVVYIGPVYVSSSIVLAA